MRQGFPTTERSVPREHAEQRGEFHLVDAADMPHSWPLFPLRPLRATQDEEIAPPTTLPPE